MASPLQDRKNATQFVLKYLTSKVEAYEKEIVNLMSFTYGFSPKKCQELVNVLIEIGAVKKDGGFLSLAEKPEVKPKSENELMFENLTKEVVSQKEMESEADKIVKG